MTTRARTFVPLLLLAAAVSVSMGADRAHAAPPARRRPAPDRLVAADAAGARSLTVNPRRRGRSVEGDATDPVSIDGPVRYDSIRTYSPAPYADSGRQLPFGLDGIGGYGSDLGVSAGHDGVLYDRGP